MQDYQNQRIEIIKQILPNLKNCVLKDGTSLLIYYGLDRYSEDIDLDSLSCNPNILESLIPVISKNNWNYRVAKDTDTVFRIMIDYRGVSQKGNYPLKLEVSSGNNSLLKKGFLKYKNIDGVNVYSIDELVKMKCNTFSQRDKIRDLYDIGFLLKKYPEYFSLDNLKTVYENINYKGLDVLAIQLDGEIRENLLTDIDSDIYVLEIINNCEDLMDKIVNSKNLSYIGDNTDTNHIGKNLDDDFYLDM